ncbi:HAMP domain-containing histidine kinase [Aquihabitans sp. G128]|uniref:sensor histidine kinase n=1 Tax=Aquihabitans sp. G128 TaxID=2849779 RepID=UPI001C24DE47|nr:HAMP domain-containing sensor histidine kinase [Aquihabitans sp. G128]QXC62293.1 HAMP domain-containing histidine kinase [Aquihabitans sp. G128]
MTELVVDPAVAATARRPWWRRVAAPRLGLRARITLAFTLSAALLSTLLAGTTWALTRENIVNQRESSATRQAFRNASVIGGQLGRDGEVDDDQLRDAISNPESDSPSSALVRDRTGNWTYQSTAFDEKALPPSLLSMVEKGQPARMRIDIDGTPELVIGIPLSDVNGLYFEFVSLSDTQSALESLSASLFGATLVTALAGAALGWWASRRTLRPLADVSVAAEAIAGGRLDTRLGAVDDPDLGVLVTSFNHMAQVLEARMDREGRFASDVSHELRSPLMTLSASIEVLASRRDEMPDASAQAAVDLMVADVARFKQLVEDLLEISRFDAGAARLDLSEIRPGELVTQSVAWSQDPDLPIELDSELAGVLIRADKRRLVRVIANLLDNARKYGGGATRIELRRLPAGVQIAVEDSGPGVPLEERDLVFDRFSRGAGSNRRAGSEGVGLGLSLVSEHVALHKGRVWVEDRPDGEPGARFVVELPVAWDEVIEPDDPDVP